MLIKIFIPQQLLHRIMKECSTFIEKRKTFLFFWRNEGVSCPHDVNEMGNSHGEHFRKNIKGWRKARRLATGSIAELVLQTHSEITLLACQCALPTGSWFRSGACFWSNSPHHFICFSFHCKVASEHLSRIPFRGNWTERCAPRPYVMHSSCIGLPQTRSDLLSSKQITSETPMSP